MRHAAEKLGDGCLEAHAVPAGIWFAPGLGDGVRNVGGGQLHGIVSYKTQDDIEASLEIDYDVIVLRSVYYPEEDAYALEQMGEATWTTHFRYGS